MCTAVSLKMKEHYFGRNLDLEHSYGERVIITPGKYVFSFRRACDKEKHPAIMGTGIVRDNVPLYFDAINEKGLGVAALSFPDYAFYGKEVLGTDNVTPFEFIPWILCQCETVRQVKQLLSHTNIIDLNFSGELVNTPLQWLISDSQGSITVESTPEGIRVWDNPVGVLTNSPPFDMQLFNLNNYMQLSKKPPENTFGEGLELSQYSRGMGAMGLPGDLSSMSRFVRATFTKLNITPHSDEFKSVSQFFHILSCVQQQQGCVELPDGKNEYTVYSCCYNTDSCVYYYRTYYDLQVKCIEMNRENLKGKELIIYKMKRDRAVKRCN